MVNIFLKLLNMSITAGWIVLAVLALRFLLKKAPKWLVCLLWAAVAVRLVLPFSIESMMSMVPSSETVPQNIVIADTPMIDSGVPIINSTFNPILSDMSTPTATLKGESVSTMQIVTFAATVVWIVGLFAMMVYAVISYLRIYRKVKISMPYEDNIYICDSIDSPFILGIMRPKIYLPSSLDAMQYAHVIAHERAHIHRRDHLWKPFGFLLLSVYWFHPLLWAGYIFLCRDLEGACDEKVVKDMSGEEKAAYSDTLLACSVTRKMISACPVAFGEVGVKSRIKSVLHYKKPAFWVIILAVIACTILAICFLTDPISDRASAESVQAIQDMLASGPMDYRGDFEIRESYKVKQIRIGMTTKEVQSLVGDGCCVDVDADGNRQKRYYVNEEGKITVLYIVDDRVTSVDHVDVIEFKKNRAYLPWSWIYSGETTKGVIPSVSADLASEEAKKVYAHWKPFFEDNSFGEYVSNRTDFPQVELVKDLPLGQIFSEYKYYGICMVPYDLNNLKMPDQYTLGEWHFMKTMGSGISHTWYYYVLSDGSVLCIYDTLGINRYTVIPYEKAWEDGNKDSNTVGSEADYVISVTVAKSTASRPAIQKNCFYAYASDGNVWQVLYDGDEPLKEGINISVVYDYKTKKELTNGITQIIAKSVNSHLITKKTADKIKQGMSLSEIESLTGCEGKSDYLYELRKWNIIEGGTLEVKLMYKGTVSDHYLVATSVTIQK